MSNENTIPANSNPEPTGTGAADPGNTNPGNDTQGSVSPDPGNTNPGNDTEDGATPSAGNTNPGNNTAPDEGSQNGGTTHGDALGDETLGGSSGDTAIKDPEDWVTGDEPMTGAQRSYLDTLAREAGEELPADLTKAQASEHIDRLQEKTGRGK
jgi:hypothetical protein